MNWGIKKANSMGVDIYLEATPPGRPLYEANGFNHVEEYVIQPQIENPDEKWNEIKEKVGPFIFFLMSKPADGNISEGIII